MADVASLPCGSIRNDASSQHYRSSAVPILAGGILLPISSWTHSGSPGGICLAPGVGFLHANVLTDLLNEAVSYRLRERFALHVNLASKIYRPIAQRALDVDGLVASLVLPEAEPDHFHLVLRLDLRQQNSLYRAIPRHTPKARLAGMSRLESGYNRKFFGLMTSKSSPGKCFWGLHEAGAGVASKFGGSAGR